MLDIANVVPALSKAGARRQGASPSHHQKAHRRMPGNSCHRVPPRILGIRGNSTKSREPSTAQTRLKKRQNICERAVYNRRTKASMLPETFRAAAIGVDLLEESEWRDEDAFLNQANPLHQCGRKT